MDVNGLKQLISNFCSSNGIDKSINKSRNTLNELINKNTSLVKITEILEILEIIENCTSCKDRIKGKKHFKEFCESINEIESCLAELEEENIISELDGELFEINTRLNNKLLCKGCYKVKKLTDKCGNRELAKFLYECRLNANYNNNHIRWIPFDKFKNIEYLAKGGFGEVYKTTWINYCDRSYKKYGHREVVLERIHNSNDKIIDILKEVKQEFIVIITITLNNKFKG
jgi:hypothetical protein